jgi:hypothetical protein
MSWSDVTLAQKTRWCLVMQNAGLGTAEIMRVLEVSAEFVENCAAALVIIHAEQRRAA